MGGGSWSDADWNSHASASAAMPTDHLFKTHSAASVKAAIKPVNIDMRESRDSIDHPNATPVIVGLDVTGSMGMIAAAIAKEGLGIVFKELLTRKPISDPQVMAMAIGDANCDRVPLQVTQFESDMRITEQLLELFLEGGGGGNSFESYNLPWAFAGRKIATDAFEKRGKKGYLFTVGDENAPKDLTLEQLKQFVDPEATQAIGNAELLEAAGKQFHIFHLIVAEGDHASRYGVDSVKATWTPLLGQRVLVLDDYKKLAEVIVSAIQVVEGEAPAAVAATWSGSTAVAVANAISGLTTGAATTDAVVRF
jgi:hypothetical protein